MNDEAQLLASLWEEVSDYIPNGEKTEIAESIIRVMMEHGNDFRLLQDAEGVCPYLDRALELVEEEENETRDLVDEYEDEGE